jgi:aspartyl-tRNA(Asn)/glutamyl-tRNA(Gln) amidotransferase subunit C
VSTFSAEDVHRLSRLARLELDADEVTAFTQQLSDILDFARQIQAVDTSAVTESADPVGSPLREDDPRPSLPRTAVLAATSDHDAATGLIKVPRVIGS